MTPIDNKQPITKGANMAADLHHAGFKRALPVDEPIREGTWTAPELVRIKTGSRHHQRASKALELSRQTIDDPRGKTR